MLSFHNDPSIKTKYTNRVIAHAAADRLIKGTGWVDGKGCAIGCTLEAYEHDRYPIELGLPVWLARLEDTIFEGLPNDLAMTWPQRFLEAVPVGVDVEVVRHKLALRRLDRLIAAQGEALKMGHSSDVAAAIAQVVEATRIVRRCHESEMGGISCDWSAAWSAARSAESAAWSAAWSAESARSARSAAWSAESARSARSARSAAWSAARSAESAAWSAARSAESAAWSAARSAESARSAWSARSAAWSAAWSAAYVQESEDLLDLLRELAQ